MNNPDENIENVPLLINRETEEIDEEGNTDAFHGMCEQ